MIIFFGPFLLLAFYVVATTPLFVIPAISILYLIGLTLLAVSKHSLFRNGIWFSFGPSKLDTKNRRRYFNAYGIIATGMLINLTSLLFLNI